MFRAPLRRVSAIVLELLLVLLVIGGGGGECRAMDDGAAGEHASHAAALAVDDGGHAHHAHHQSAPRSSGDGEAPAAPDCVMTAACAPVLAAVAVPLLRLPAPGAGDAADRRPYDAPPSALRQVEPPPPRA